MNRETAATLLVIICILAGLVVAQPLYPSNSDHFSSLGLLGPQKTLAGYPSNVLVNQTFVLYASVGNYEGTPSYYQILIKLGNSSTVITNSTGALAPTMQEYSLVLQNGNNATIPMNLSINKPGFNQRLLFELWSYNATSSSFTYTGVRNQLWLNVTGV